jgi:hypothetical protein
VRYAAFSAVSTAAATTVFLIVIYSDGGTP